MFFNVSYLGAFMEAVDVDDNPHWAQNDLTDKSLCSMNLVILSSKFMINCFFDF